MVWFKLSCKIRIKGRWWLWGETLQKKQGINESIDRTTVPQTNIEGQTVIRNFLDFFFGFGNLSLCDVHGT